MKNELQQISYAEMTGHYFTMCYQIHITTETFHT